MASSKIVASSVQVVARGLPSLVSYIRYSRRHWFWQTVAPLPTSYDRRSAARICGASVCVCVLFCAGFGCCAEVKRRWGGYAFSRQMEVAAF